MFCPCRCKGCEKGTGNYSSVTEQTCQFDRSGSSKHRVNDEGLIKDDNKKSRLDAESADGICKTKKKLLEEVFLKAKHLIPLVLQ